MNADPLQPSTWPVVVGATANDVAPAPVWYGIWLAAPPARLVAVVALVAEPESVAVIVPALKLPDASRATTVLGVLADAAFTSKVRAVEPSKVPAELMNEPAVKAATVPPDLPEMSPDTAEPEIVMLVFVTLVIWPCAFTANTGTAEAEPYVLADTPVLVMLNCVPESVRPVPAVYSVESLTCANVMAVVPNVIVPDVLQT